MNILSKIVALKLFRFEIDSVWKIFELKNDLINDGGACRTAPATPGLLIPVSLSFFKTVGE